MYRQIIQSNTELGQLANSFINHGNLVPDEITNKMVKTKLTEMTNPNGYLLDGYPRTIEQVKSLTIMTTKLHLPIDMVINIKVNPTVLTNRLSGRFMCKQCDATYHTIYHMPKIKDTCDV